MNKIFFYIFFVMLITSSAHTLTKTSDKTVVIILGSTREKRSSEEIARALKPKHANITFKIADLRDYQLPFLADPIPPASRKEITDAQVKRWSEVISNADGFIIIVPEYNGGYPGVLKNALDSLYKEWNNKPVGFVGYSGGPSGGRSAIAQIRTVAQHLEMVPVGCDILIPNSSKALTKHGDLENKNFEQEFTKLIDQIVMHLNKNNKHP